MASYGEEQVAAVRVTGGWACYYAIRVYVALRLKGVEYEFLQEVVGNKSELLLRSNPVYKKIPVLLHHGKPIAESVIILQYIDEVWASDGAPVILPADPYARAVQRFWAQYVDDKVLCNACLKLHDVIFVRIFRDGLFFYKKRQLTHDE